MVLGSHVVVCPRRYPTSMANTIKCQFVGVHNAHQLVQFGARAETTREPRKGPRRRRHQNRAHRWRRPRRRIHGHVHGAILALRRGRDPLHHAEDFRSCVAKPPQSARCSLSRDELRFSTRSAAPGNLRAAGTQDYQSNRPPLFCCSFNPLLRWAAQTSAIYGHVVLQSVK